MKKFLIVLSCVALVLPLFALSAFAEDSYTLTFTYVAGSSSDQNWYLNGVSLPTSSGFTRTISEGDVISFGFDDDENEVILNDEVIGSGWGSEADCQFTVVGDVTVSYNTYTFTCSMDIPPVDPFSPVNDGVDSSITFTGQVLHFLATNTTTIVLIGLSVAMFAVLPFAIRKIKQIIKGY